MNKVSQKHVDIWNAFCEADATLQEEIRLLLRANLAEEEVRQGMRPFLERKEASFRKLVEGMVSACARDDVMWYLERSTKLAQMFHDFVRREVSLDLPEVELPWVTAVRILYDNLEEARRRGAVARATSVPPEWKPAHADLVRAKKEICDVLEKTKVAASKELALHILKHIDFLSRSLIRVRTRLSSYGVAKVIEDARGCQILIEAIEHNVGSVPQGTCLLTNEGRELKRWFSWSRGHSQAGPRRHFIFYQPCQQDINAEEFIIGRQLGHCALHWPLLPGKHKIEHRSYIPEAGGSAYAVKFSEKEQAEADIFALSLDGLRVFFEFGENASVKDTVASRIHEYRAKGLLGRASE
ncbi:MAG: hypothetical protein ACYTEL_21270 [Planctomycetota bacterium]|jgi:hypothetical protein